MNDQELQDLIKLKRYEQPEEGYFESFLEEFHERQRSEILTGSARGLLFERVGAWFGQLGAMRWAAGAGMAYAAVAVFFYVNHGGDESTGVATTEVAPNGALELSADVKGQEAEIVPVSMVFTKPLDFSASKQPLGDVSEQLF